MKWKPRLARLVQFRHLGWKLTLSYTLVTAATLLVLEVIVIGLFFGIYFSDTILPNQTVLLLQGYVTPQLRPFLQTTPPDIDGLRVYLEHLYTYGIEATPGQPILLISYTGSSSEAVVLDTRGHFLASMPAHLGTPGEPFVSRFEMTTARLLDAALSGEREVVQLSTRTDDNWYVIVVPVNDEQGKILGAFYFSSYAGALTQDNYLKTIVRTFVLPSLVIITLIATILGTFLGFLTARGLTRRLHVLATTATAWGHGDFAATVYDTSPDEVGQLGRELNHMAERIQELLASRQQLAGLEERNRLARELHDSVKQQVFAATMNLGATEVLWDPDPAGAYSKLTETRVLLQQTQHELQALIHELRPAALEDKGLAKALHEYTTTWSQHSNIPLQMRVQGERLTPLPIEWALFRVAQEALSNVARHSQATSAALDLLWTADTITLTLHDNGKGFDPAIILEKGLGLRSMRERLAALDGTLTLTSAPGEGATLQAAAPLVPQARKVYRENPPADVVKTLPETDAKSVFSWYAQSVESKAMMTQGAIMLETHNLTRRFGTLVAVDALNLTVHANEMFGFLGPNGAGKTTTLRMLVGLLAPSYGTATIAGRDIQREAQQVKRIVGYLPDDPYLYAKLTGREHLRFVAGLYGLSDAEGNARIARLLELVEMEERADDLIETYSHGMRKRLALCAILLHEPRVLLLDEPLNGLDPRSALRVKEVLRMLCTHGATVLFSTHTLEIAERMCDRVGIIDHGHLVAVGSIEELRAQARAEVHSTLEELFMRLTGGAEIADVAAILAG